jgi:hypothetical protein
VSDGLTLPVVGRAEFRRRLAGLVDPGRIVQESERDAFRELARDVIVSLCIVYGSDLERKMIWSRIDSALQTACAKVDDGDTDRWLDLLLDHVRAEPARTVRLGLLRNVRASLSSRDEAHRRAFVRWVESRRFAALAFGRAAWEEWKRTNANRPAEVEEEGAE